MKTSDFDYALPRKFIAQNPAVPRDSSRLLVYDSGKNGQVSHKQFFQIKEFLNPGDVLVVNRSKVIPARILFKKKEIFLLKKIADNCYQCLVKPGGKFGIGMQYEISGNLRCAVVDIENDGSRVIKFESDGNVDDILEDIGITPLPPYITKSLADSGQYQTVYAREKGSVAAPTAGLHFTENLLKDLISIGVQIEEIVLHVGRGTFLPVSSENLQEHHMHEEEFEISNETADRLSSAVAEGRRIIAVGTTSVRVLESVYDKKFTGVRGFTDIFIYPGYKWKIVDGLVTNFHLPKSTLIMLVASFLEKKGASGGRDKILELYEIAKKENYRFFSFGDAMLII
ncbi:tRNA preQ1(34) S-adenosylmethionine ribosyltransferase-isomerase QueA [Candidatus Peregrinibacteria bacterium]|nr:tRNA preQ1(34) S-adenosylmethionine ribosyltransferase-isomerase QueA [Candidatus Peregrinibacteria bacterium]